MTTDHDLIARACRRVGLAPCLVCALAAVMLTGCEAKLAGDAVAQRCTDTRDGESWTYQPENVRDIVMNPVTGEWSATVIDDNGNGHWLNEWADVYLKCEPLAQVEGEG